MKNFLPLLLLLLLLSSCGSYVTTAAGKEDVGYVAVIKESSKAKFKNVELVIDGKSYLVDKVVTNDKYRKVRPIVVSPGKHQVKVIVNGNTLVDENVLVGLQETRKIILR